MTSNKSKKRNDVKYIQNKNFSIVTCERYLKWATVVVKNYLACFEYNAYKYVYIKFRFFNHEK